MLQRTNRIGTFIPIHVLCQQKAFLRGRDDSFFDQKYHI